MLTPNDLFEAARYVQRAAVEHHRTWNLSRPVGNERERKQYNRMTELAEKLRDEARSKRVAPAGMSHVSLVIDREEG